MMSRYGKEDSPFTVIWWNWPMPGTMLIFLTADLILKKLKGHIGFFCGSKKSYRTDRIAGKSLFA